MKFSSTLTLLSSSLLLASAGLQAAVIQVSESVSNVVYQGQQVITEEQSSVVNTIVETQPAKQVLPKPEVLIAESIDKPEREAKTAPIILPLPLKISPTLETAIVAPVVPKQPLAALVVKPLSELTASSSTTAVVLPNVMPTTIPVHPVLNTSALVIARSNEAEEEASLFSAISDWFSVKPVKPWQKGTLAKKAMKPGGEVPEFDVFSEKVFAYKQGSIGGNGVGGGGCGCN